MLNGKVTDAKYAYQRTTYVRPIEHQYGSAGEQPYVKYGCPVCELLNNKHQVTFGSDNCPLCNVNLLWEEPINSNRETGGIYMIKSLVNQVTELNAGVGHVSLENIEKKKGITAVISVYDNQKPAHMVLNELYEWANKNNEEVKLLIEKLEKDMSWNSKIS